MLMQRNLAVCDDNQKILKSKISRRVVSKTPFESPVRSTVKGSIVRLGHLRSIVPCPPSNCRHTMWYLKFPYDFVISMEKQILVHYGKFSETSSFPSNFSVLLTDFSEDGNLRVKCPNTEVLELPVLPAKLQAKLQFLHQAL